MKVITLTVDDHPQEATRAISFMVERVEAVHEVTSSWFPNGPATYLRTFSGHDFRVREPYVEVMRLLGWS